MMKAKFLLGALVFPMIFGACTNDIFEQEQQPVAFPDNSLLNGRATLNPVLSVERIGAEEAQTRVVGDITNSGIEWKWSGPTDGLGAVVVDYAQNNAIVDLTNYPKYAITNYPFMPNIDGAQSSAQFTTNTAVVEGAYIFYSQYDGTLIKKSVISDEIPRVQIVNAGKEAGLRQIGSERGTDGSKEGQNLFVSPIVNISLEEGQATEFPLALTSANSILHIQLNADLADNYWGNFSVNKIVLKALNASSPFYRSLTLNPKAIETLQAEVRTDYPNLAWMDNDDAIINGNSSLAKETVTAVLNKIMSRNSDGKVDTDASVPSIGEKADPTQDLVYQLENKFTFDKNGNKVFDLYVIMPAGEYLKGTGTTEYEGKNAGALQMTVYTSEGTYNTYLGSSSEKLIAHRGELINITKTLKIKPGDTNINLYDFENEGFDVETTEDWEYAIDYINNHLDRFGQGSTWSTPKLNLKGEEIVLNEGYYFPEYPVSYSGDATTLIVKGAGAYTINAKNVVLDPTHNPTIKFENSDATVAFSNVNATSEFNLISAAQINIAEGQALTFKKLESSKGLQVGAKAAVTINSDEDVVLNGENTFATGSIVTATTTGKVTLNNATLNASTVALNGATNETTGELAVNANAALTVNGAYTNEAVATIDGNATATLNGVSVNEGEINVEVEGALNATKASFTNNGSLTLKGTEKDMDDDARSKATFKELVNNSTIVVENGGTNKGTYGGCLTVNTKVTNNVNGTISVNGEFFATDAIGTNYGVVKLMGDKYAVIQLNGSNFKSQNDGYIEITDPTAYEMFNTYYTIHNEFAGVEGPIVATLSKENWPTVWSNYKKYNGAQETAWAVINTVRVNGTLEFTQEQTAAVDAKDLILSETSGIKNAETSANKTLTFKNIIVEKNAKATFESAVACSLKCANINIEEGATLDNNKNVKVFVEPALNYATANTNVDNVMLTVNGTLNNNGEIHTTVAQENVLKAIVGKGAFINNYGKMGTAAKNNVNWSKSELINIDAINGEFYDFVYTHYVRESGNSDLSQSTGLANSTTKRTWALFVAWQNATPDSKGIFSYNGKYYKVSVSDSNTTEVKPALIAQQKNMLVENFTTMRNNYKYDGNKYLINNAVKSTWSTSGSTYVKSYGYIQDFIFIYLNEGTVVLNNPGATAYGFIKDNTNGTLTGTFTQDYSSEF